MEIGLRCCWCGPSWRRCDQDGEGGEGGQEGAALVKGQVVGMMGRTDYWRLTWGREQV
jgi:hypothetical protein